VDHSLAELDVSVNKQARSQDFTLGAQKLRGARVHFFLKKVDDFFVVALNTWAPISGVHMLRYLRPTEHNTSDFYVPTKPVFSVKKIHSMDDWGAWPLPPGYALSTNINHRFSKHRQHFCLLKKTLIVSRCESY